jgi:hypothetical protein
MVLCIMRACNCGELPPPVGVTGRMKRVRYPPEVRTLFLFGWIRAPLEIAGDLIRAIHWCIPVDIDSDIGSSGPLAPRFYSDKKAQGFTSAPSTFRLLGDWGASLLLSSF